MVAAGLLLAVIIGAWPAPPGLAAPEAPAPSPLPPSSRLINLEFRNADIADVLTALARNASVNIVTDTDVKGKITVRLVGVTLDQALQIILEANGLAYALVGNSIVVAKKEKLAHPFLRQYHPVNIAAKDFAATILPVSGLKKDQVSVDEANNILFVFAAAEDQARVQTLLASVDSPNERPITRLIKLNYIDASTFLDLLGAQLPDAVTKLAKVDKASNSLVLTATGAQMQTVDALVSQVDTPLPQVLIEASVIEVPTEELKNLGAAWQTTTPFTVQSSGTPAGQISLSVTAPGILAILNTLIRTDKAHLLASPRLAVRSGETAKMNIGDKIPFQVINPQGVPSVVIIEVGVKLEITPRVNTEGFITLHMHPEVSAIKTAPAPNVPPTFSTREAQSSLTVKDASSIVLAGLIQKNETKTTVKVPLLGDIPILGWLFRSESSDKTNTEIIFVITPHILHPLG